MEKGYCHKSESTLFWWLRKCVFKIKRYDPAIEAYHQAIQMAADRITLQFLHNSLGICLAEVGRYDEAVFELKKAIDLAPKKADYYYTLGKILGRMKKYEEAISYFETTLKLNPGKR